VLPALLVLPVPCWHSWCSQAPPGGTGANGKDITSEEIQKIIEKAKESISEDLLPILNACSKYRRLENPPKVKGNCYKKLLICSCVTTKTQDIARKISKPN
jgi:hypothetical protein